MERQKIASNVKPTAVHVHHKPTQFSLETVSPSSGDLIKMPPLRGQQSALFKIYDPAYKSASSRLPAKPDATLCIKKKSTGTNLAQKMFVLAKVFRDAKVLQLCESFVCYTKPLIPWVSIFLL